MALAEGWFGSLELYAARVYKTPCLSYDGGVYDHSMKGEEMIRRPPRTAEATDSYSSFAELLDD